MDSVIPIISDRDYVNGSRKGMMGGLEASPFADGIRDLLSSMRAGGNTISGRKRGSGYNDLQACQT